MSTMIPLKGLEYSTLDWYLLAFCLFAVIVLVLCLFLLGLMIVFMAYEFYKLEGSR